MKPLKFILSSLFSNETIVNESKKQPWWLAIVLIIVSCIVSVIPSFVSVMRVQGSNVITAVENYDIDYGLKQFSIEYLGNENNKIFIKDKKLTVDEKSQMTDLGDYSLLTEIKREEKISLLVYYVDFTSEDEAKYQNFNEKMSKCILSIKASHPIENTSDSKLYSTLILGQGSVLLMICDKDAKCTYTTEVDGTIKISSESGVKSNMSGNYDGFNEDLSNISGYYYGSTTSEKVENAYNNWKLFFDKAYETPRNLLALQYVGIFVGIDLTIALAMGLMIFLLSKTKASVKKYKFLESLKMVFFASFSPSLISLLLGFMIPSFQSMAFVMCYILRITWLGMKATNPPANQPVRK